MNTNVTPARNLLRPLAAFALAALLLAMTAGCEPDNPTEQADYDPDPHITAFITNGEPVGEIFLEWVGRFGQYYDPAESAINNATVLLFADSLYEGADPDTIRMDTLTFTQSMARPNVYLPDDLGFIIQGRVNYRIEVTSDEVQMAAETRVPGGFGMRVHHQEEIIYNLGVDGDTLTAPDSLLRFSRSDPELFFEWDDPADDGGHVMGIHSLDDYDPADSTTWPLNPDYDPEEDWEDWEDEPHYIYTIAPDYQHAFTLPWLYYEWGGHTRVEIQAASYEYYRYVFSRLTGNDPSNPLNLEEYVEGGLGIFGANTVRSYTFFLARNPEQN